MAYFSSLTSRLVWPAAAILAAVASPAVRAGEPTPPPLDAPAAAAQQYSSEIVPLLETHCYGCHGYGSQEGSVTLDEFPSPEAAVADKQLWFRALRMIRADMMPPAEMDRPTDEELATLEKWIKRGVLAIDPENPDPGRVTVRRLNRVEYANTIRDLMGVRFDAQTMFPPDDTGHGFDNIGDVLTMSPLHLEKYIEAAEEIVADAVPTEPPGEDGDRDERRQYRRFFPEPPPENADERRPYVEDILRRFVTKAYRRPADDATVERLADLAQSVSEGDETRVEAGVARAMTAVLASPRFLFREEQLEDDPGHTFPYVDQYALASRLSYFLWSSMPDDELMQLAGEGKLRDELPSQLQRMLKANKAEAFIRQFAGQWLRARDIETTQVDARAVLGRENPDDERDRIRRRFRELQRKDPETLTEAEREELDEVRRKFRRRFDRSREAELDRELRQAMKRETEMLLERIVQEDRSLMELVDADYTFLNERLAKHYGIEGVTGDKMQLVELPDDGVRGGVLTQGTTLVITSNPDRTSPAKRGLYVLEALLGTPPPPPPPDIPSLEQAEKHFEGRTPTARVLLELHRADPVCASCHNRMDPIGLALENFNALGMWRDEERGEPIDATGELITGESFEGIRELKRILAEERREDFLRCATEKMLTFALGRGLDYNDVETVDQILERVVASDGRASALMLGIVESAPFLRSRPPEAGGEQAAAK